MNTDRMRDFQQTMNWRMAIHPSRLKEFASGAFGYLLLTIIPVFGLTFLGVVIVSVWTGNLPDLNPFLEILYGLFVADFIFLVFYHVYTWHQTHTLVDFWMKEEVKSADIELVADEERARERALSKAYRFVRKYNFLLKFTKISCAVIFGAWVFGSLAYLIPSSYGLIPMRTDIYSIASLAAAGLFIMMASWHGANGRLKKYFRNVEIRLGIAGRS